MIRIINPWITQQLKTRESVNSLKLVFFIPQETLTPHPFPLSRINTHVTTVSDSHNR